MQFYLISFQFCVAETATKWRVEAKVVHWNYNDIIPCWVYFYEARHYRPSSRFRVVQLKLLFLFMTAYVRLANFIYLDTYCARLQVVLAFMNYKWVSMMLAFQTWGPHFTFQLIMHFFMVFVYAFYKYVIFNIRSSSNIHSLNSTPKVFKLLISIFFSFQSRMSQTLLIRSFKISLYTNDN